MSQGEINNLHRSPIKLIFDLSKYDYRQFSFVLGCTQEIGKAYVVPVICFLGITWVSQIPKSSIFLFNNCESETRNIVHYQKSF